MSKKDDLKIDIMSSIDDEIIEKHTKKRFDLLSGKGFGRKRKTIAAIIAFAACLAMLASFIVVILPLIPTGQIPVYQGMTVSNEAPVINTESADARPFTNNKTISLLGKHNGKDDQKNRRPVVDIVKDSLTVDAESEYLYYSKPNEDIYITVHVNNPGEFEILSFTLNGVKYSSYMFEEGSDLENLVLKINVGDAEGVVEYTIDAIKYVEGTKIKDVLMEGDKTVSVAITPDAPIAEVTDVNIGISNIGFNTSLNDEKNLVNTSGEDYFAVICNEDTIISKQIISSKDKTQISFTGLDPDTTYRYAIIGVYDAIDGEGKCIHVIHEEEFSTQALVSIGGSYLDGADVCFDITWHESHTDNKTLDALALYDGENKIADLEVTDARISDLPFDKEFTLVATYTYNGMQYETYKAVYSPKSSEGLTVINGTVTDIGSCTDTTLYINMPVADAAFANNKYIERVYLGSGVTSVGKQTFSGCTSLKSISIPDSVTSIGADAFLGCSSLTSITIPDSVTSIGAGAFADCSSLTSITIPDSITSIGVSVFDGCSSLTSITIPDSVTSIGDNAFYNCSSLTSITIPDSVTDIGEAMFEGCSSLTSITIPDSVTDIGYSVFKGCNSLTNVYISDIAAWCNIKYASYDSNPLYYANNLYLNGDLVTDLVIPDSVTSIGDYAFVGCNGLTSITIPDSVTSIGSHAFEDCASLTSITIPDSVTSIGSYAFYGCRSLTSITIPASVKSIGSYMFSDCDSLTGIYYNGTMREWNRISIGWYNEGIPIVGSDGSLFRGNWHCGVDQFIADLDGELGNDASGDDTHTLSGATGSIIGTTITYSGAAYPVVTASCVQLTGGWLGVDGHDVENFVCNVYDTEGRTLKTVDLSLNPADEGVWNFLVDSLDYDEKTVPHRFLNDGSGLIDLSEYAGQTVTVVYSVNIVDTDGVVYLIEIDVIVPVAE